MKKPLLGPIFARMSTGSIVCRADLLDGRRIWSAVRSRSGAARDDRRRVGTLEHERRGIGGRPRGFEAQWNIPDDAIVFGIVGSLDWNDRVQFCYGSELVRAAVLAKRADLRSLLSPVTAAACSI